jgi:spermidine synthase
MKKWNHLEQAQTSSGLSVSLHEHDGFYSIRLGGAEYMSTRQHASEERLAELCCLPLTMSRGARVLIGGLGFGFTLKAALRCLPPDAKVIVAEPVAAIVEWNQNPLYQLATDALADPRVQIVAREVGDVLSRDQAGFDAIILDTHSGASTQYAALDERMGLEVGLQIVKSRLKKGGRVGYWSVQASPPFEKAMRRAGFNVEVHKARSHATSGGLRTLFIGRA